MFQKVWRRCAAILLAFPMTIMNVPQITLAANEKESTSFEKNQKAGQVIINAVDYGADPSGKQDSAQAIWEAFEAAKKATADGASSVVVEFPKGEYHIYKEYAQEREYHTSNTNSTSYPMKSIGILIEDQKNFTLDGQGSLFIMHGNMMSLAVAHSQNVKLQNFSWDFMAPTISEMTVVDANTNYVDYYIPASCPFEIDGTTLVWNGGKSPYTGNYYWTERGIHRAYSVIAYNPEEEMTRLYGTNQGPFKDVTRIEKIDDTTVRFHYNSTESTRRGDGIINGAIFQLASSSIRETAGGFFWESSDIVAEDITVHSTHGFGWLTQMSHNITYRRCNFMPREGAGRFVTSYADGIHASGASGNFLVEDCNFSNTHDDPINIHGTFTRVEQRVDDHTLVLKYIHDQQGGFPQFHVGDKVQFFTRNTLESSDNEAVYTVQEIVSNPGENGNNLKTMKIRFNETLPSFLSDTVSGEPKYVAENTTYAPAVTIRNCTFKNVTTRAILATTRNPIIIENCTFLNMCMPTTFFSNDSNEWYESGPIRDLTMRNNTFYVKSIGRTSWEYAPAIYFHPVTKGGGLPDASNPIHKNVIIEDNTFYMDSDTVLYAESVENIRFANNKILRYHPEIELSLSLANTNLNTGDIVAANLTKSGNQNSGKSGMLNTANENYDNLFHFLKCKNVVVENNTYDDGLKMTAIDMGGNIDIDIKDAGITYTAQKNLPATDPVANVTFVSTNPEIAEVDNAGTITAKKAGSTNIFAYYHWNDSIIKSNSVDITVSGADYAPSGNVLDITTADNLILTKDQTQQYVVSGVSSSVVWSVENPLGGNTVCAEINESGLLTAKESGIVLVKATAEGQTAAKVAIIQNPTPVVNGGSIKRENSEKWTKNSDSSVTITLEAGDLWNSSNTVKNLFLFDLPSTVTGDDMIASIHASGLPINEAGQWDTGSFLLYSDDDNYISVGKKSHFNGFATVNEVAANADEKGEADGTNNAVTDAAMVFVKVGNTIRIFVQPDGESSWTELRTITNSNIGNNYQIGFAGWVSSDRGKQITFSDLRIGTASDYGFGTTNSIFDIPDLEELDKIPDITEPEEKPDEIPDVTEPEEKPDEIPDVTEPEEKPDNTPDTTQPEEKPDNTPDTTQPEEKPDNTPDTTQPEEKPDNTPDTTQPEEKPDNTPDTTQPEEKPDNTPDTTQPEEKPDNTPDTTQPEEKPDNTPDTTQPEEKPDNTPDTTQPEENLKKVSDTNVPEELLEEPFNTNKRELSIQNKNTKPELIKRSNLISPKMNLAADKKQTSHTQLQKLFVLEGNIPDETDNPVQPSVPDKTDNSVQPSVPDKTDNFMQTYAAAEDLDGFLATNTNSFFIQNTAPSVSNVSLPITEIGQPATATYDYIDAESQTEGGTIYRFTFTNSAGTTETFTSTNSFMIRAKGQLKCTVYPLDISGLPGEAQSADMTISGGTIDYSLDSIFINHAKIKGFSPDVYDYIVLVPSELTSINFSYMAADTSAGSTKLFINNVEASVNGNKADVSIPITAQSDTVCKLQRLDGEVKKEYTVTIHPVKDSATTLNSLEIPELGFSQSSPTNKVYYIKAPTNQTTVTLSADIAASCSDLKLFYNAGRTPINVSGSNGSYSAALPLYAGLNSFFLEPVGEDGVSKDRYIINITRNAAIDATLNDITIDGNLLSDFQHDKTEYTINSNAQKVSISAQASDSKAKVSITVNGERVENNTFSDAVLKAGVNKVYICVTADDVAARKIYELQIVCDTPDNSNLLALSVDNVSISPMFHEDKLSYSASVYQKEITVRATPLGANAKVLISGNNISKEATGQEAQAMIPLYLGANTITVLVTAADGMTQKTYTLEIDAKDMVYLSDMNWESASTDYDSPQKDMSCEGNPLKLASKENSEDATGAPITYAKGLAANTNANFVYNLSGKQFNRFQCYIGINYANYNAPDGSIEFKVFLDGVEVFKSDVMTQKTPQQYIDIDITDVSRLELVANEVENNWNDHANWADAKLVISDFPILPGNYTVTLPTVTNGTVSVNKSTANSGDTVTVTVTPNAGYQLKAGSLKANGVEIPLAGGVYSFTMPNENVTITAEFEQIPVTTYTVTFHSNGGTPIASQEVEAGSKMTEPTVPTLEGYRFAGWYQDAEFITAWNFAADVVNSNVELYAKWESTSPSAHSITVSTSANGTISADKTTAAQGDTITVTVTPDTGYQLKEGTLKANGIEIPLAGGVYSFTMPNENVIITAEFEQIPVTTYIVTFHSNGGTPIASQEVEAGSKVTEPTVPTLEGYRFAGWYQDAEFTTAWNFADVVNSNVELYAKWESTSPSAHSITVSTSANGTISADKTTAAQGDTITVTVIPDTGYQLKEGTLKANGSEIPLAGGVYSFTMPNENVIITAEFEQIPVTTYIVTFHSNGGTPIASQEVEAGSKVTEPTVPTLEGYRFAGWYQDAEFTTAWNFAADVVNSNVELYAKWESTSPSAHNITVSTSANGAISTDKTTAAQGDTVTVTVTPNTGYQLKAGSLKANGVEIPLAGVVYSFTMPNENVTITAEFEQIPVTTYTVTFHSNGGTPVASQEIEAGGKIIKPNNPVRQGYYFRTWYQDSVFTTVWDFDKDIVTKNMTLYASWTPAGGSSSGGNSSSNDSTIQKPEEEKEKNEPENTKPEDTKTEDTKTEKENSEKIPQVSSDSFVDIKEHWANTYIDFVISKGLFYGTSETEFSPNTVMNRGMLVTVLFRLVGNPEVGTESHFTDIGKDQYYTKAVVWANKNGIVHGITDTQFSPDTPVSREQIAVMLMNYAKLSGMDVSSRASLDTYYDAENVSAWAKDAVSWAVANGILSGTDQQKLECQKGATRAEVATMLYKFISKFSK